MGLYLNGKLVGISLPQRNSGSDEITATNTTGSAISADDKVWVEPEINYIQNFGIVGSPTIENQIASGFSTTDYLTFPAINTQTADSWEIVIQFLGIITGTEKGIFSSDHSFSLEYSVSSLPSSGRFKLYLSSGNSGYSWDIADGISGSHALSAGATPTYIKLKYENGVYTVSYSRDNETWIEDISISSSAKLYYDKYNINNKIKIGVGRNGSLFGMNKIRLLYSWTKEDNTIWTPYTTSTTYSIINDTDITSTSFTGIAQSNIANNATGSVKTLLDGSGTYAPTTTTKTITTNGTYTASAENAYGLSEVTVNVPSAPTKKYNLLDRVKDDNNNEIGTVSGFFTDANNVEYAVVCLDAQYRLDSSKASGSTYCSDTIHVITDLPVYQGVTDWGPWEAKETATFNTQKIIDYCSSSGATSGACSHCRSKSFAIDGTTYYGQLPNMIELNDIIRNHTALDTADPTASSYSLVNFTANTGLWSSSQAVGAAAWCGYAGSFYADDKDMRYVAAPVLEIPNT